MAPEPFRSAALLTEKMEQAGQRVRRRRDNSFLHSIGRSREDT
jgi:hypothetical protein